jgi:hypothetical protein
MTTGKLDVLKNKRGGGTYARRHMHDGRLAAPALQTALTAEHPANGSLFFTTKEAKKNQWTSLTAD